MKNQEWFNQKVGNKIAAFHANGNGSIVVSDNAHAEHLHKQQGEGGYSFEDHFDEDMLSPILEGVLVAELLSDKASSDGYIDSDNQTPNLDSPASDTSGDFGGGNFSGGGASNEF